MPPMRWLSQNRGFAKGDKHDGSLLPFFKKGAKIATFENLGCEKWV